MRLTNIPAAASNAVTAVRRWPVLVPRGRARIASLVLGVLVLLGSALQVAVAQVTALPDNAVLRTGDTVVTENEFRQRVDVLEALYGLKPPTHGPKLDRFRRDAAKSIAVSLILDRAAAERNVVVADKQARDVLNKIIEEQLRGGRDAFVQFLGTQGINESDVLAEVRRQLATSKLFEHVTANVKPTTEAEVRRTYQQRKHEMVRPERRHLLNIVVDSKENATAIIKLARSGANFARLASQYSLDRSTKDRGGDLGTLSAEQLDTHYAQAAFGADEGAVFGPIKTQHGWNVGKVVGIEPAQQLPFGEVKKQLEAELNTKRKLDAWRSWLGHQIRAADVEYADDYRPANPDAPPTDALRR